MARRAEHHPIRQLVIEAVAVVEEAAQFEMQSARIYTRAAGHPADRAHPGQPLDHFDAQPDMLALHLFRHDLVIEPAVAVADDLVSIRDIGADEFWVALGRLGDRQQAYLDPETAEQTQQPPAADPRAVFEHGFDQRAPEAWQCRGRCG